MKSGEYNIDSLFREKLEGLEPELSEEAVNRMNRIISRKRNHLIFRRISIAAGISLILASSLLLIRFWYFQPAEDIASNPVRDSLHPAELTETREGIAKMPQATNPEMEHENDQIAINGNSEKTITPVIKNITPADNTVFEDTSEIIQSREIQIIEPLGNKSLASLNPVIRTDLLVKAGSTPAMELENKFTEPIVMEYIHDPDTKVTAQDRSGGIAGIIEKAGEIRNEMTLGSLREAKDQLFALEFIKSRKTENSK